MVKSRWAISYKDIYNNYNYDSLNYLIDIIHGFYSAYKRESEKVGLAGEFEEKKIQMIRYEIIAKFCQYAESLGAFIRGYRTHHLVPDKESKILSELSRYKVTQIDDEYKLLTKGKLNNLIQFKEQLLKNIFGYYNIINSRCSNNIRESLLNIKELLKEIYYCYRFYKDSYNSYKHGYRLWFAREQKTQLDIAVYIPTIRGKRKRRKYVPSDDGSLSLVLKCSRYCRQLFDILIGNERQLLMARKKKSYVDIDISFLTKNNGGFDIQKQICSNISR
jgi:hypothetical protein